MRFGQQPGEPFSPSPEQEQAFLDEMARREQQPPPTSVYQQPAFWADLFGNAVERALQPQRPQQIVVIQEDPVSQWLPWIIGGAAVVVVVKALR